MLNPVHAKQFKKDYKLAKSRSKSMKKLIDIMDKLMNEEPLAQKHRDHNLTGNYVGCRECHVEPDWLLIYSTTDVDIYFIRTGTHSDLFGK
jgi:mRNA interferase YafQ